MIFLINLRNIFSHFFSDINDSGRFGKKKQKIIKIIDPIMNDEAKKQIILDNIFIILFMTILLNFSKGM